VTVPLDAYDAGQFVLYLGVAFEALIRDKAEFLNRHFVPTSTRSGADRVVARQGRL
jgi:hypothetical protein